MRTYVIGDLQGCHTQTVALVERILEAETALKNEHGDKSLVTTPSILFTGDLINRGPDSLATLRYVHALASASDGRIDTVLGNHDLHLLAVAHGIRKASDSDTLAHILDADDGPQLLDWLRTRPLAIFRRGHLLVHGGVLPQWTAHDTLALAAEVETVLRGPGWIGFLSQMYGNTPDAWSDELTGTARLRCIVNALTRLRFCTADGVMDFKMKESAQADPASGLMPWFDVPGRRSADVTVAFGHWSALGLLLRPNLIALDTGCVWGGYLSAVCLDDRSLMQVQCPEYRAHGGKQ